MPSYVYTYVLFHLLLNTSVSSRLTTILITRLITIRYTYHSQYDIGRSFYLLLNTEKTFLRSPVTAELITASDYNSVHLATTVATNVICFYQNTF
jgi:hypothetical protein